MTGQPAQHGRCGPDCGCAPALADDPTAQPVDRNVGALPVAAHG